MLLRGGPLNFLDAVKNGGTGGSVIYNTYFLGNYNGGPNGVLDARGLSSVVHMTYTQSSVYFKDIDIINAIGVIVIDDFQSTWLRF